MKAFIDTSAFLAVLDADDRNHRKAKAEWIELITSESVLFSNNYVLVETFALVQHRLGMEAVRSFNDDILPLINIEWIDESTHKAGINAMLVALRRKLSLVDCVSFETMRLLGVKTVFAFDAHFEEQGFNCMP